MCSIAGQQLQGAVGLFKGPFQEEQPFVAALGRAPVHVKQDGEVDREAQRREKAETKTERD